MTENAESSPTATRGARTANITKGSRVRVTRMVAKPAALAGMQMKLDARVESFTGTIAHVRGDHPTAPTAYLLFVDPDDPEGLTRVVPYGCTHAGGHVEVEPRHVVEVLT